MSERPRGAEEVRAALVGAACEMLGEKAPHLISGRELARRAGVNYGLVHHYFGGKGAVLREGLAELARSFAAGDPGGGWTPTEPFSIGHRQDYLRALAFASLAGDIEDVATVHPVVEATLADVAGRRGCGDDPDRATRVDVAVGTLFQLGWCLFEHVVVPGLDLDDDGHREMQRRMRLVLRAILLDLDAGAAARGVRADLSDPVVSG